MPCDANCLSFTALGQVHAGNRPEVTLWGQLQALVYDIRPRTTASLVMPQVSNMTAVCCSLFVCCCCCCLCLFVVVVYFFVVVLFLVCFFVVVVVVV